MDTISSAALALRHLLPHDLVPQMHALFSSQTFSSKEVLPIKRHFVFIHETRQKFFRIVLRVTFITSTKIFSV